MTSSNESSPGITILVTGFGRYRGFNVNPSWQIASSLPASLTHRGINIRLVITPEPIKSEYHYLIETVPKLLNDTKPHAFVNLGQDEAATDFMIERGARRDVYFECPDMARRVLTKAETREIWAEGPARIETGLDLDDVLPSWRRALEESAMKGAKLPGLGISDDAGNYVCGLMYYATLEHLRQARDQATKAVFLHVPPLKSEKELQTGKDVTIALIKAVAERCEY